MSHGQDSDTQRAILVTGASSGIGKACAIHLDERGFQVFAGVRKLEDGLALQNEAPEIYPLTIPPEVLSTSRH